MGFEPMISWLRTKRPLQAGTARAFFTMAQVGFEPTASLGLNEGGLPVAYRAVSSGRRGGRTLRACFSSAVFETAAIAGYWLALPSHLRTSEFSKTPQLFPSGWLDSNQ